MNIIVLNDSCEVDGGAARIAIEDARQMASRGHRVIFFAACGKPPENSGGIEWHSLGQRTILDEPNRWLAIGRGLWNAAAARALKPLLRVLPPESTVVHLHSWSKALSGSVVATTRAQGHRIVCTLHDYFAICPNGGLYDYPTRQVCHRPPMSLKCVSRNCDSRSRVHKMWRVLRQWIWRHVAGIPQHFDCMIAVSGFAAARFADRFVGNVPVQIIDNLPVISRPLQPPVAERSGIIYAGRIAAEKGVDLYLEACRVAGIPAEVWGDGPLLPQLRSAWPNARFLGWQQSAVLQARMQQVLVLVVPSLWYETYGMVAAEAAAAGVAVIVSGQGAAAELVEDGVTGLHFHAGDAADLAQKISRLHQQPQLARLMGETAYQRFWQGYDQRRANRMERIEACYRKTLGFAA